jgi:hypothetical protein
MSIQRITFRAFPIEPRKVEAMEPFERCPTCRRVFDRRDLADVLWHADPDHDPEPRRH